NNDLRSLIEYRSRLLSRLTHELRNPLTSILGFTEILLNYERLSAAQRDFCQKIQTSAVQIENNLRLLSDLAHFEAGNLSLSIEEFALVGALQQTCAVLDRQAAKKNVSISWQAGAGMPPIVSDRSKVRQLFFNLIGNAINRSPIGAAVTV